MLNFISIYSEDNDDLIQRKCIFDKMKSENSDIPSNEGYKLLSIIINKLDGK